MEILWVSGSVFWLLPSACRRHAAFLRFFYPPFLQDVFKCSCNDIGYKIPANRAKENYNDGAFWCSGTLNILGYNQNPIIVFNPYSYAELQIGLIGLDAYLHCTSVGGTGIGNTQGDSSSMDCESKRPSIQLLEDQGVSSIAVLSRYLLIFISFISGHIAGLQSHCGPLSSYPLLSGGENLHIHLAFP